MKIDPQTITSIIVAVVMGVLAGWKHMQLRTERKAHAATRERLGKHEDAKARRTTKTNHLHNN
jgi:hypothetical protein